MSQMLRRCFRESGGVLYLEKKKRIISKRDEEKCELGYVLIMLFNFGQLSASIKVLIKKVIIYYYINIH